MPSLRPKDRVSLCQFTFADGRGCRMQRALLGRRLVRGDSPLFFFHLHADHALSRLSLNS